MTEWWILASVKLLKTALLAGISLVSSLATGLSDAPPRCDGDIHVVVACETGHGDPLRDAQAAVEEVRALTEHLRATRIDLESIPSTSGRGFVPAGAAPTRAMATVIGRTPAGAPLVRPLPPETSSRPAEIRRVPPIRVEMTFTPDLLRPPTRDPSL